MTDDTLNRSNSKVFAVNQDTHGTANTEFEIPKTWKSSAKIYSVSLEVQRLQNRSNWLSGLLVASVIATSVLAALVLNLIAQQNQQARQLSSLTENKAEAARLSALEGQITRLSQQVKLLNQQVPSNFSSQLTANQEQVKDLQIRLSEAKVNADVLRQVNERLLKALSNQNPVGKSSMPTKPR